MSETYVIPLPPVVSLPVEGSTARFPVRRVYCVGRNYAAHAREMGHDPDREPPFFFQKNAGDVVGPGEVPYPPLTEDLHHEVELVVAIGRGGKNIAIGAALGHVYGYAVGLDLTRRDVQAGLKKAGRPWEPSKAFAQSAPVGTIQPAAAIGHPARGRLTATVDCALRQEGDLGDMIWNVAEIIAHLSRWFELEAGDLVFTGTPAGVGELVRGNVIEGSIEGIGALRVAIV